MGTLAPPNTLMEHVRMPHPLVAAVARLVAPSRQFALRAPLGWLLVFLLSGAAVLAFPHLAETLPRAEVIPAVLGVGLSAPLGWYGARVVKK